MNGAWPLTPLEQLLVEAQGGDLHFFARLRFAGRFERAAFEAAARSVLERHPLAASTVARVDGRACWRPGPARARLRWLAEDAPEPELEPETPERVPGLETVVREGRDRTAVTVRIHHAVCDGRGALLLLRDFFVAYARALGREAVPEPLETTRIAARGHLGLRPALAPLQLLGLVGVRRALGRRPLRLPGQGTAPVDSRPAATPPRALDRGSSDAYRRAARLAGVSENAQLLRDTFVALGHWLRAHGEAPDARRWLRLLVPCDLRTLEHRSLPAANVLSQVYVDRRFRALEDPAALLRGLHGELALIRGWRLELAFLLALAVARGLPPLWRLLVRAPRAIAPTALHTALGPLHVPLALRDGEGRFAVGDLVLQELDLLGPLLPHVPVSLTTHRYAGRLTTSLRYDPAVLSSDAAAALHEALEACLLESARRAAPAGR